VADDLLGLANGTVPADDQRPSYLLAKQMATLAPAETVTTNNAKSPNGTSKTTVQSGKKTPTPQTASPNQGRSNSTGGQGGGNATNDLRGNNQHVK
jgi:hypothetical protein